MLTDLKITPGMWPVFLNCLVTGGVTLERRSLRLPCLLYFNMSSTPMVILGILNIEVGIGASYLCEYFIMSILLRVGIFHQISSLKTALV